MNHTKMLTELKGELIESGYNPSIEHSIRYNVPNSNTIISGKSDCIIEKEKELLSVIMYHRRQQMLQDLQLVAALEILF